MVIFEKRTFPRPLDVNLRLMDQSVSHYFPSCSSSAPSIVFQSRPHLPLCQARSSLFLFFNNYTFIEQNNLAFVMKVIVCFGETRILVPCDAAEEMTVKDLTEKAVARYKKVMNKVCSICILFVPGHLGKLRLTGRVRCDLTHNIPTITYPPLFESYFSSFF